MAYYVLEEDYDETNVLITDIPANLTKKYQLLQGISRLNGWPEDVTFRFSANRAEGLNLTDLVENTFSMLIISNRFKEILEGLDAKNIEFLPVQLKNHKGRMASKDYWIGNLLVLTEAVDRQRSVFQVHPADKNRIFAFERLALRDEIERTGPVILRLQEMPRMVLARQDLVERITQEKLTGMKLIAADKYKS